MRMTDLVSGLNLTLFPIIGLVLFGLVFVVVLVRTLSMSRRRSKDAASLPLDDGPTDPAGAESKTDDSEEGRHG